MVWQRLSTRRVRNIAGLGIVSLLGAGFTAHATLASLDQIRPPAPAAAAPKGYEADDHFPGALYFELAEEDGAPAPGVTGTTRLPDRAAPTDYQALDAGTITAAQPFVMRGSATDRARAAQCLTTAIYYEAATEPDNGQRAVAQVILNRVRHPAFPDTVCGVVYQGSDKRGCQFSFACDGSLARTPERKYWLRAKMVAEAALAGSVFPPVGLATHYHTYAVTPAWNRSLVMTGVFGAHFFHRWKGWWGTAAAFNQVYAGGEPLPGPHKHISNMTDIQLAAAETTPAARAPVGTASTQGVATKAEAGAVAPQYAESGQATSALPQSQVLDKWKDSGKPLR
ncbi:cell wall hydrolase [Stakelama marina]|uniref:Cell wall hydrolase n=1 Tax=Stakelama marina TaxID=2826939 RepID=A0A8T4IDV7_9SPHN|nr:cell wall hydrolase [Stakelama marina]MBR0552252.1 cell wall hydrolase [Stakelama marina]